MSQIFAFKSRPKSIHVCVGTPNPNNALRTHLFQERQLSISNNGNMLINKRSQMSNLIYKFHVLYDKTLAPTSTRILQIWIP